MKPIVANERSPENDAPSLPTAVEMGTLQPQPSLGPLELIERDQQIKANPQQPSHIQPNKNESASLNPDTSQQGEPAKQSLGSPEDQDHGTSQISGHAEADKSKHGDSSLEVVGSPTGKHNATKTVPSALPAIRIILLLPTGARHNLCITENYLREQNMSIKANDLFATSVYTLKELILRDWHEGISYTETFFGGNLWGI